MPTNRRPFNTVFQDYALFPHMTVEANVGYGLMVRGRPKAEIRARWRETSEIVGLGAMLDRYPSQLSGGQKQRVALARAIVCEPQADSPRRAAGGARRRAAPADAAVPQGAAAAHRRHLPLRHPRPGGGDHHVRPHRGDEQGPDRADRHAEGDLLRARRPRFVAALLRRQQHRRCNDARRRGRDAARQPSRSLRAARRRGGRCVAVRPERIACSRCPAPSPSRPRSRTRSSSAPRRMLRLRPDAAPGRTLLVVKLPSDRSALAIAPGARGHSLDRGPADVAGRAGRGRRHEPAGAGVALFALRDGAGR